MIFSPNKEWVQVCTPNIEQSMTLSDYSSQEKAHNHATHGQTFKNRPLPLMNFMALPSPVAERLSWTKQGPAWNPNEVQRVGSRGDESKWLIIIAPSLGQWAMCFLQCAIWCNVKCVMYKMSNYLRHCTMCCLYSTMALWYFGYSRKTLSHGKTIILRLFFLCSFRKKTLGTRNFLRGQKIPLRAKNPSSEGKIGFM